jgi:cyanophycin synthetase
MTTTHEPKVNKSSCSYCGDAAVNHPISFFSNLISVIVDAHATRMVKHAPKFIKNMAEWFPVTLFETFAFLKMAKFSSDIEKANTFRSRIIWEEAERRGIPMEQLILFGKPMDHYRARVNGKRIYFESLPIPPKFLDMRENWDDKIVLKREFAKNNVPIPQFKRLPYFAFNNLEKVFSDFQKPIIVKPQVGSRGRHTITNIHTFKDFKEGVSVVKMICPYVAVEEHLDGYLCRATIVNGKLGGFYRASAPFIIGDGEKTIKELIEEKDSTRESRIEAIRIGDEFYAHLKRSGYDMNDILPRDVRLTLSYRAGRLFGGSTKEMIDELHPSFIPILEHAGKVVDLAVAGFDCIIPDPTKDQSTQRWGIIECNTLPFIDLHYYTLEGKPRNIAGMIWDMWN